MLLNVSAGWVELLPVILEVLGSNLGQETGYNNRVFFTDFLVPPGKYGDSISI
jgi:hypothetical protein